MTVKRMKVESEEPHQETPMTNKSNGIPPIFEELHLYTSSDTSSTPLVTPETSPVVSIEPFQGTEIL